MKKNSICCVIVTYNIGKKFYQCYNAIKNQVEKVVIVDNGSNNETLDMLKNIESNDEVSIIFNSENLGIAKALNQGIEIAIKEKFEWVITMDNDSIATENMIDNMLSEYEKIKSNKKIVSLFPRYVDLGYNTQDKAKEYFDKEYTYVNAEITSGNLVKTEVFKEVGLFEEKLFIDMVDYEFCFRLRTLGYELVVLNNAILYHNLGNTKIKKIFGKNMYCTHHNAIRRYYITRNRFYTWKKYKKYDFYELKKDKKAFLKEIAKIILLEEEKYIKVKMMFKGYKDYKKNRYGKLEL